MIKYPILLFFLLLKKDKKEKSAIFLSSDMTVTWIDLYLSQSVLDQGSNKREKLIFKAGLLNYVVEF